MFYPSQEYAPIGSLKARYRPLGLVAQGQFGKVYCAVHRASGRLVALKLMDRQRSTTSQFLRELSSLLTLSHPALIQLRAIEQTESGRCLVLDYSAGGTLRQLLAAPTPPRQELMLQCLLQVLEGLAYAHGRGIVHCDVKPENILMQLKPQGWRACLTDFGIAQSCLGGDVLGGDPAFERVGSPAYMAPERYAGEAYPASDLYSVGVILYEVLLGDRPFRGSPNALRDAHRQEPVKFPKPIDIAFQKLLYRALSKSPDLRYESATAMALELGHALATRASQSQASASGALFSSPVPEALLTWPEPDWARSIDWALKLKVADEVCLAGISPLLSPRDAASQGESQWGVEQSAATSSLGGHGLKQPQLWLFHGQTLQGLSLGGLESGAMTLTELFPPMLPREHQDLVLSPESGFVLTDKALYRWPLALAGNAAASVNNGSQESQPWQCLLEGQADLRQFVLSPQGHWAVVVKRCPRELASSSGLSANDSLLLLNLSEKTIANAHCQTDSNAPTAQARELKLPPSETLTGVQLLDRRHGAALIASPGQPQRLGLFSRRGQWLSYFTLAVSLDYWVRGIPAYELWALEAGHPKLLLKLGLKPFRLERIPLAIAPDQIHPLPWGCVLANQAGEILFLNREGQSLGQVQVPIPNDCHGLWLVPMASHCLLVVMQQPIGLKLWPLDLRQLELMLVF